MTRKDLNTMQWKKTRLLVLARDNNTCAYCGRPATTVDHVVPVSKGGDAYDTDNMVAACVSCNMSKQDSVFLKSHSTVSRPISILSPTNRTDRPLAVREGDDNE